MLAALLGCIVLYSNPVQSGATDQDPPILTPGPGLTPFEAEYSVSHLGLTVANTVLSLEAKPDQQYLYRSITTPAGVSSWFFSEKRSEEALFKVNEGRIQPLSYRYQLEGGRQAREVRVDFDWTRMQATNTAANHAWRMSIPESALDKLSVQLVLTLALQTEPEHLTNQVYEYPVADGGRLKTYHFQNQGQTILETPIGHFQVLRLVGRPQYPNSRPTELWLAPSLGYLPVRIDQAQGSMGTAHMHLEQIRFSPTNPSH